MADFEAISYQGSRNRGNVLDDTEGDYDEEQDEEREYSPRQCRRSGALKRAHCASVGQNGSAPPSFPSVGGANDPFLAGVVEQARVRDAAMAEQQQQQSAALVAVLLHRQRGGSATALLQELRSIEDLRAIGAIVGEIAIKLLVKARADFL